MSKLNRNKIIFDTQKTPRIIKRSRAKIWIRTGILLVFGALFSTVLYRDLISEAFSWQLIPIIILSCLIIGFWMRKFVPMQIHIASSNITFSFDKIYFVIILILVSSKFIAIQIPMLAILTDIVMCIILGLMLGRLSGICLRVRSLKIKHHFNSYK